MAMMRRLDSLQEHRYAAAAYLTGDQIYPRVVFVSSAARTSIESGTVSGASELTPIHSIQLLCGSTESDTRIISVGGVRLR